MFMHSRTGTVRMSFDGLLACFLVLPPNLWIDSWQMQELEKVVALERMNRHRADEQIKLLLGDTHSSLGVAAHKSQPTKVAEAALAIVDGCLDASKMLMQRAVDGSEFRGENGAEQQTALGLVLNDIRVETTVPGSPACTCGLIERLDDLLMVDGQKVNSDTALSALRGDDEVGAVVSILLRKASTGEVYAVHLPRIDIAIVKLRQVLYEDLVSLQAEAILAIKSGDSALILDRLNKIKSCFEELDKSNLEMQHRLSAQVAVFKESLHRVVNTCKCTILDVDSTHQQVHVLQHMTEAELRLHLAGTTESNGPSASNSKESILHTQIHELEGALKALQNELSAMQMLRREALEQAEKFRFKVHTGPKVSISSLMCAMKCKSWQAQELEEKLFYLEQGQRAMRETVATLEDQLADAVADILEYPFTVALTIDQDFDSIMQDSEKRLNFELGLRDEISNALQISKSLVSVLSYHRGSIIAEVKLSNHLPTIANESLRTGKMLAAELARKVDENYGPNRDGTLSSFIIAAEVHGPISELTVKAFKASLLEREREHTRMEEEVKRLNISLRENEV